MTVTSRRSIITLAAASVLVLSACTNSAPPARELALEFVDTLEDEPDSVRACMRGEVEEFRSQTDDVQFDSLDAAADTAYDALERLADNPDAQLDTRESAAIEVMQNFEAMLESCR